MPKNKSSSWKGYGDSRPTTDANTNRGASKDHLGPVSPEGEGDSLGGSKGPDWRGYGDTIDYMGKHK